MGTHQLGTSLIHNTSCHGKVAVLSEDGNTPTHKHNKKRNVSFMKFLILIGLYMATIRHVVMLYTAYTIPI